MEVGIVGLPHPVLVIVGLPHLVLGEVGLPHLVLVIVGRGRMSIKYSEIR